MHNLLQTISEFLLKLYSNCAQNYTVEIKLQIEFLAAKYLVFRDPCRFLTQKSNSKVT